jgi:hypothetical protein
MFVVIEKNELAFWAVQRCDYFWFFLSRSAPVSAAAQIWIGEATQLFLPQRTDRDSYNCKDAGQQQKSERQTFLLKKIKFGRMCHPKIGTNEKLSIE